ncbi:T9SS type A sorting domain-containing protein, partial [Candidatus Poribacteria bacterium]|nr:T9SS type A sorting domain-containing protein [Candidatus Poribacteria bacterium]
ETTWIPYQLAESADVTLTIYDMSGQLVRRLAVGHQAAGMYRSRSRAIYWDGRNQLGEFVASGLYFFTLIAGEFTATRRMLILK